jgi:hypothetical protein
LGAAGRGLPGARFNGILTVLCGFMVGSCLIPYFPLGEWLMAITACLNKFPRSP